MTAVAEPRAGAAAHRPRAWVRGGIWVVHLSLPLLGLWLLVERPSLDARWEHHGAHLWLVAAVGAVSAALAARTRRAAHHHRDARLALVALAFFAAAGFLFLHALATPQVLADGNYGFMIASPFGLVLASLFAAASAVEWRGHAAEVVLRREQAAWWGLVGLFVVWAVLSVGELGPFDRSVTPDEAHGPLVVVAVCGGAVYAAACIAYARLYRRRPAVLLLGVLTGFALLAEALVAMAWGRDWQASWWEWHLLMAAGFAFILYSAEVQYQREGTRSPAVFAAAGLDETLRRIRAEYGSALEAMVEAMQHRVEAASRAADGDAEGEAADAPSVTAPIVARFDLTEGQSAVLEEAADALAAEREELRRLGELVALGRQATVAVDESAFLSEALGHAGEAFRRHRVAVALVQGGGLRWLTADPTGRLAGGRVAAAVDDDRVGAALASGEAIEVPAAGGGGTVLLAPLLVQGVGAGVLTVHARRGFDERDRAVVRSFAGQLSTSLENTRLYRQIDVLFRQYMSPEIVTTLLADPSQAELGGAVVEVTSLFADLRGFTSFSERTDPSAVVDLLNRYFGVAVPAVLEHGGTVTQYAGDNIMAVFNAPTRQPDHALRAARAALALQAAVRTVAPSDPDAPVFRVGINTGPALVGNVGAEVRCYTANGDSVNLAARLEGQAPPGGIVIGGATYAAIGDRAVVEDLGELQVKGKDETVRAYLLAGLRH